MRARGVVFAAPRRVEVRDVEIKDPGPGEVVVRSEWSGISAGTELLAYRGEIDPALPLDETLTALGGTFEYPFPYGYSAVGTVKATSADLPEGARVFAFHPHQDRFVAAATDLLRVDAIDPRTATLFPLVETALQVAHDAGPRVGEVAVVIGLGAVGILVGAMLGRAGVQTLGSEPSASRREAASRFGIRANDPEDLEGEVRDRTAGRGADVVIESSGNPDALDQGLRVLAHEGTAVVCSWYGAKPVPLSLGAEFHRRRLRIVSSQVSTIPGRLSPRWDRGRRAAVALDLLRDLPVEALATHDFPFERAADAYEALDRGEEGLIHAALRYADAE